MRGVVAAAVLAALVGAWFLGRWWLLRRSLPQTQGTLRLRGLHAGVEIHRDRIGVPHVEAGSLHDAAFAMGVVHAQDRLWQMELNRRIGAGRLSEFAGERTVAVDRFIRRVGIHRIAVAEAARLNGDARIMLEAYAAGVNAVIQATPVLPLEFRLLKLRPEPWTPADSILTAKLLALALSLNWDTELQRFRLLQQVGPEVAARLEITYPEENPTILERLSATAGGPPRGDMADLYRQAAAYLPRAGGGSNSWVVGGGLTESGKPILCNDPHLSPSVPSVWYTAHVTAGDDFESIGVTSPGLPFPILGHNREVAWGFTNSFADCQDLVVEEFTDASGQRHRTENGPAPSQIVREVIRVRGGRSDLVEEVVITRHGPVVERLDNAGASVHRGLALQWTALAPGDVAGAHLGLQRAHDWISFRRALAGFDAPSQNVVYADRAGHIGYFLAGRIPLRRRPPSGLPVPGWEGDALWQRLLSPAEVPQVLDPPEQVLVTANNRVVAPGDGAYIGNDFMSGYRAARIRELLSSSGLSARRMRHIQMDVVCAPARQVAGLLQSMSFTDLAAEKLRARLADFDGVMAENRREPMLYEAFMLHLAEAALRPLCGDAWALAAGVALTHEVFGYPANLAGRITPFLLEHWREERTTILSEGMSWPAVVEAALAATAAEVGRRRGRWGRAHAIPLRHQALGEVRGVGWLVNAGRIRVGGNTDTVLATSHHPARPFATTLIAPSWRQVMDLSDWDACSGVHYPGQSGQPGSRHYRDLSRRWRENRHYPLIWSATNVRRNARDTLRLVPVDAEPG